MVKPKVTRTYGPIHFEDLDPHRFEDLVRELIYDYKDWQSIEATGRSGSDEGFDIRAYEKAQITSQADSENEGEVEEVHPMEGNLWMIQGKREKEIGPAKVRSIISEIDVKNPPYGYILAASADFSKKSYDVFREELRKKGVMEFYLWGKAELEDMLHLPKNDRILFTFFGISLVSKRRSRTTEVRSSVIIKNKLYRAVGEGRNKFHQSILIRDLKDIHYPYEDKYKDFKKRPRWREYIAYGHHPLGLCCHTHEYFACIDTKKKEWDFTEEVDLVHRHIEDQLNNKDERESKLRKQELVRDTWDFFPKANQGYFVIDGIVKYSEIALVDDKGDVLYDFPHLYVDFVGKFGPFVGIWNTLKIGNMKIDLTDDYKRIKAFPDKFQKLGFGKIYKDKKIILNPESLAEFKEHPLNALYESDKSYSFLNPKDVISVANTGDKSKEWMSEDSLIQITYKFKAKIKDYVELSMNPYETRRIINIQLGRDFDENEKINIYEFRRVYKHQFKKSKK